MSNCLSSNVGLGAQKKSPFLATKVKQEPPPPARSPEKGTLPKEAIEKLHKKSEGAGGGQKSTSEPVDLSKSSNNNNNNEEDGDVPPGMVRGPNGQLWPAWVFCTRYSDRPSSGKSLHCSKKLSIGREMQNFCSVRYIL